MSYADRNDVIEKGGKAPENAPPSPVPQAFLPQPPRELDEPAPA